jgi:ribosomal protein S18 acetylase RimI-like enzyme
LRLKKTINKIDIIDFTDTERLDVFLNKIDENTFSENKKITNAPWKHANLKHFHFLQCENANNIDGVMVYSVHDWNYHLNFIYVLPKKRSLGIGKIFMNIFLSQKDNNFFTIHVDKTLDKTIRFYKKYFGFEIERESDNYKELKHFKNKCLNYNPNTYNGRILMYRINNNVK